MAFLALQAAEAGYQVLVMTEASRTFDAAASPTEEAPIMRALRFDRTGSLDGLGVATIDRPVPGAGEALVRV